MFLLQIIFCSVDSHIWITFLLSNTFFIMLVTYYIDDISHQFRFRCARTKIWVEIWHDYLPKTFPYKCLFLTSLF